MIRVVECSVLSGFLHECSAIIVPEPETGMLLRNARGLT